MLEDEEDEQGFEAMARTAKRWLMVCYISGFGAGWLVCYFTH
jgi:hypothetical protein